LTGHDLDDAAALEHCLAQLERTAAWLRSLPLARFGHGDGAVPQQAGALISRVAVCVQDLCRSMREQDQRGGGSTTHTQAEQHADCPPADSVPERLPVHALGDQLAVHAADLARCGRAALTLAVALPVTDLDAITEAALRLRSSN
jgi:hypothetical protein